MNEENKYLEERFKKYNIQIYKNGELRPLYEILKDASKIYPSLSDNEKDDLGTCFMGHYYTRYKFENNYLIKE